MKSFKKDQKHSRQKQMQAMNENSAPAKGPLGLSRRTLLLAASGVLLQGCAATVGQVDPSISKPSPGHAGIYYYRQRLGPIGMVVDSDLVIDGKLVGTINGGDYIYLELPAGKHKYLSGSWVRTEVEVDLVEGKNYFFEGNVHGARSRVSLVTYTPSIELATQLIKDGWYKRKQ